MSNIYTTKIKDRAIQLYNERIDGRRVYSLNVIKSMLKAEFPGRCDKITRATIYLWLKKFDGVNYRNGREAKNVSNN